MLLFISWLSCWVIFVTYFVEKYISFLGQLTILTFQNIEFLWNNFFLVYNLYSF